MHSPLKRNKPLFFPAKVDSTCKRNKPSAADNDDHDDDDDDEKKLWSLQTQFFGASTYVFIRTLGKK